LGARLRGRDYEEIRCRPPYERGSFGEGLVALAIRTGISPKDWEESGEEAILTAWRLIAERNQPRGIDPEQEVRDAIAGG
jgi:hypothetical protein